jgi:hypothetical protein
MRSSLALSLSFPSAWISSDEGNDDFWQEIHPARRKKSKPTSEQKMIEPGFFLSIPFSFL